MMRKISACLLSIVFAFVFIGCGHPGKDDILFSLDEVEAITIEPFSVLENDLFAYPFALKRVDDKTILVADARGEQQLMQINLSTGEYSSFLNVGRGPMESQDVANICLDEKNLFVFSGGDKKVLVYSVKKGSIPVFDRETKVSQGCRRILPIPGGKGFLGLGYFEGRFLVFDDKGAVLDTVGTFPPLRGDPAAVNNSAAQSVIAYSPDGKWLCSPFLSMDCIEIYPSDFSYVRRLWGPERFSPEVRAVKIPGGTRYGMTPSKNVYATVSTSNEGFIVGYIGQLQGPEDPLRRIWKLLRFDWKGNCRAQYILPEEISTFDVDWERGKLYAIAARPQLPLVVADIDLD